MTGLDAGEEAVDRRRVRQLAFLGFAGSMVGNGLARFAYTPLIPALVEEGWVTTAEAGYLGAWNFAGYFLGALAGWWLGRRMRVGTAAISSLALCAGSLFLTAIPWGYWWMVPWRFLAGCGGGVAMVLVPPAVLRQIPPRHWGFATGGIFAGLGFGIALSGTAIPLLAALGGTVAWLGLAVPSTILTLAMAVLWREPPPMGVAGTAGMPRVGRPTILLCSAYFLYAIPIAAYSIFWVDFLARGLGLGLAIGGLHWTVLGLVSLVAPLVAGWLAGRFSFGAVLGAMLAVCGVAILLPAFSDSIPFLYFASVMGGALFVGCVTLFSGRTAEIAGLDGQRRLWWIMTLLFAVGLAGGSWGLTWLFEATADYRPVLALAGAALLGAAFLSLPVLSGRRA